jgi:hypothetical protein
LHVGRPYFLTNQIRSPLFQDVFVGPRKWFRPAVSRNSMMTILRRARMILLHQRSDSSMLEAIVLLLAVSTCALILIAFWGLDLLGMRRRRG